MSTYAIAKGTPGLLFSNFYMAESAVLQDDPDSEGGFVVYGKTGEEDTGYSKAPAEGSVFKGVCIRNQSGITKHQGCAVAVMTKGLVWVGVTGSVTAGSPAFIGTDGKFASAGTAVSGGTFKTNSEDGVAVLELA